MIDENETVTTADTADDVELLDLDGLDENNAATPATDELVRGNARTAKQAKPAKQPKPEKAPKAEKPPKPAKEPKPEKQSKPEKIKPEKQPKPEKAPKAPKRSRANYAASIAGQFVLADGERVLQQYAAIRGGTIYLTNRRLLVDGDSAIDLPVEKVKGVSCVNHFVIKWGKIIFGALFVAACVLSVLLAFVSPVADLLTRVLPEGYDWIRYVVLGVGCLLGVIGLLLLCYSIRRKFALNILTEGIDQVVSCRTPGRKGDNDMYSTVVIAKPGREYARFVGEIGARLRELDN